jgi:D-alanyl-D-alanine carboxypeptidase
MNPISRRSLLAQGGLVALASLLPARAMASAPRNIAAQFADKAMVKARIPGISAAIFKSGQMATGVAGYADPQAKIPMASDTRLMSGSTGKTFCAVTVLSMVEDGQLELDKPLKPLFADEPWFLRLPNANALTLRILLNHSAGFPQFLDLFSFQAMLVSDSVLGRSIAYSPRKMLSLILDTEPLNAPGAQHHYSDLHYHLAGLAIEKVTGASYYAALQSRVLDRLGYDDVIPATSRNLPGLAAGFARGDILMAIAGKTGRTTDKEGVLRNAPNLEYTGGGLALTPRALADFYQRLLAGQLISQELVREMFTSSLPLVTSAEVKSRYGLGIFINERAEFGRYISHTGYFPGYMSNAGYFIDHGFAAALQVNSDNGIDINNSFRELAMMQIKDQRI